MNDRPTHVRTYFAIAFGVTWVTWLFVAFAPKMNVAIPPSLLFPILVFGSFGPFFGAFLSKWLDGGLPATIEFASRAIRVNIGLPFALGALFLLPALGAAATAIYGAMSGHPFAFAISAGHIPMLFVMLFFLGGSFGEEFGWAYATDSLIARYRPVVAIGILGLIWSLWHLPLFFIAGTSQSHTSFLVFVVAVVSMRFMYAWAYLGSRKSILATLLFHTTGNLTYNLYVLVNVNGPDQRCFLIFALLAAATAGVLATTSPIYRSRYPGVAKPFQ